MLHKVAVAGGELPVWVDGKGPPLLLLHGWTLDHRMWGPQRRLADQFCCFAPDRRGFGANRLPADQDRELDDIDAMLVHFGLDSAYIIGMSQGGRIALRYAASRPGRVAALVLHAAPLDGFEPQPHGDDLIPFGDYRALIEAGNIAAMREAWRRNPLLALPGDRPELGELLREIVGDYQGQDLLAQAVGPRAVISLVGRLGGIDVPTLALVGQSDGRWLHLVAEALAYGLPQGQKRVLEGGGHMVNWTNAEGYNQAIAEFFVKYPG